MASPKPKTGPRASQGQQAAAGAGGVVAESDPLAFLPPCPVMDTQPWARRAEHLTAGRTEPREAGSPAPSDDDVGPTGASAASPRWPSLGRQRQDRELVPRVQALVEGRGADARAVRPFGALHVHDTEPAIAEQVRAQRRAAYREPRSVYEPPPSSRPLPAAVHPPRGQHVLRGIPRPRMRRPTTVAGGGLGPASAPSPPRRPSSPARASTSTPVTVLAQRRTSSTRCSRKHCPCPRGYPPAPPPRSSPGAPRPRRRHQVEVCGAGRLESAPPVAGGEQTGGATGRGYGTAARQPGECGPARTAFPPSPPRPRGRPTW